MRKQTVLRLTAFVLVLGGLWSASTQQRKAANLEIQNVRGDLYVITGGGGNVGVLVTGEGVVLVDDKFDRDVPQILAKVKSITDQPVRYVLNTHHHGDHTGGNAALIQSAEVISHGNARRNMASNSQPGLPGVTFDRDVSIFLGGKQVQAHYFGRGHTDGDAVIYFPGEKVIHTGDLFVRGAPYIDYGSGGGAVPWRDTLEKILELDFDTVIPGHGPVSKREDIVRWARDYETVRKRLRELSHQGKSVEEVEQLLKLDDLRDWSLSGLFKRSLPDLYKEVAQ